MAIELFSAIINKEIEDIKESLGDKNINQKNDIIDVKGDIIIPLNIKKSIYSLKSDFSKYIDGDNKLPLGDSCEYINKDSFLNEYISNNVKIAKDLDLVKFMKIFTKELFSNDLFYGCVITDGKDFFLNISHPLVLKYLKDNEYKNLPKKFIAIFFYISDNKKKEFFSNIYKKVMQRHAFFTCYYNYKIENLYSNINFINEYINDNRDFLNLDDYITIDREIQMNLILTPIQIYTRGELVPSYGYVLHDDNAKAFSSIDFVTGNISDDGILCTGDYNKKSLMGWRTINKCNLNSMYFSNIINAKTWFESFKAALDIDKMILQNQEQPLFCQPTNSDK